MSKRSLSPSIQCATSSSARLKIQRTGDGAALASARPPLSPDAQFEAWLRRNRRRFQMDGDDDGGNDGDDDVVSGNETEERDKMKWIGNQLIVA
jgi:hypothetical protein